MEPMRPADGRRASAGGGGRTASGRRRAGPPEYAMEQQYGSKASVASPISTDMPLSIGLNTHLISQGMARKRCRTESRVDIYILGWRYSAVDNTSSGDVVLCYLLLHCSLCP